MTISANNVQTSRRIDPKVHVIHRYSSREKFLEATLKPGIHTVWHGGLPIDMQLTVKESDTLIVVLHGAATGNVHLPWLSGSGITREINASRLFVSDPSLYLGQGLALSWFAGNQYQPDLQATLIAMFKKVADSVGATRIIFFGGSGGGFASLRFSHSIPGSTAVVFNPQTIIERYPEQFVSKWLDVAWGSKTLDELPDSVTVDLTELYNGSFLNRVIYMQNQTDSHHELHFVPFLEQAKSGDLQYLVHDESPGHTPPPKEMLRKVLEQACETAPFGAMPGFQLA